MPPVNRRRVKAPTAGTVKLSDPFGDKASIRVVTAATANAETIQFNVERG
jgi:hypothetical protein